MSVTVVVGGQFGSEGKGKLVSHLARTSPRPSTVVRCGGPNAGHTADGSNSRALLRQLPAGAVAPDARLLLAAGMQIDVDVLLAEIAELDVTADRVGVDPNAVLVEPGDAVRERTELLGHRIGSTETGTGAALARKTMRGSDVRLASADARLAPMLCDVAGELNDRVDRDEPIIVEGTQGAGLSIHHGPFPHVTARDTIAAAFLSEAGLSPRVVDDIVLVVRTYPIRVAGGSGPLTGELTWTEVARRARLPETPVELTTVTNRQRRVGEFDWAQVVRAARLNRPTALAVHGLDYLDAADRGVCRYDELGRTSRQFVTALEDALDAPARFLFTGPAGADLIDRVWPPHMAGAHLRVFA